MAEQTTITLTKEQETHLTTLLNCTLRNTQLGVEYRETMNGIFKQLAGRDHDVVERLRKSGKESQCSR